MPRGGTRQGSGPKPLSDQGKVPGPTSGRFSLTSLEAEALTDALEERSVWLKAGSPEWIKAVNGLAVEIMKAAIHKLPHYQDMVNNRQHMAALEAREQIAGNAPLE